jgi:cysteine desulfurase
MRPEVKSALRKAEAIFGNPSSAHQFGQQALALVDKARAKIAGILNCRPEEIIFTSGGSEADNLAIKGLTLTKPRGHIVTTAIEHKAVLESCRQLEDLGYHVSYINPDETGVVSAAAVMKAVREDTVLVSIMYVNNEIGVIQPIEEIGQAIAKLNREEERKIYFHTDAVQAASFLSVDTDRLHVDALTLSGHKLGGPKGVGLLFVKTGLKVSPQVSGGGQERGLRSGTLNTTGIVGLATALELTNKKQAQENLRLTKLKELTIFKLKNLPGIQFNSDPRITVPGILNFSIPTKTSDQLVMGLDLEGVAVSAASACSSGAIEQSYVLKAMGKTEAVARSSVRISFGWQTRKFDVTKFVRAVEKLMRD